LVAAAEELVVVEEGRVAVVEQELAVD